MIRGGLKAEILSNFETFIELMCCKYVGKCNKS